MPAPEPMITKKSKALKALDVKSVSCIYCLEPFWILLGIYRVPLFSLDFSSCCL
jgi:hypothetical protein